MSTPRGGSMPTALNNCCTAAVAIVTAATVEAVAIAAQRCQLCTPRLLQQSVPVYSVEFTVFSGSAKVYCTYMQEFSHAHKLCSRTQVRCLLA
jgi:hypothetical protein